jgi:hypothetical protein
LFAATFCALHAGFWLFVLVRDLLKTGVSPSNCGMAILGFFMIFMFFGPITSAEFAFGYAAIDSVTGVFGQPGK